jgi:predicted  nucleic acid-binding Zn-ribbon protein
MSETYKEIINEINKKVDTIISKYDNLNTDFITLKKENESLLEKINLEKENNKILESKFDQLKVAKVLEKSDEDIKNTKSKINKLVKEIDRCIALLNVD